MQPKLQRLQKELLVWPWKDYAMVTNYKKYYVDIYWL